MRSIRHDPLMTRRAGGATEAEQMAEQERLLADLADHLASRETEFATTTADFARFRAEYLRRFSPLYQELDAIEAAIARLLEDPAPKVMKVDPKLRELYRQAAKLLHPDLAGTGDERERRTKLMVELNDAYRRGDAAAVRQLMDREAEMPAGVAGNDVSARLNETLRKIAQVQTRLSELTNLEERLSEDAMWHLFIGGRAAWQAGDDPLGRDEAELRARVADARLRLEALSASRSGQEPRRAL
jgi:uncharacterized coiled-coil protein SlyX